MDIIMKKQEKYFEIQKIFDRVYKDADCSLDYKDAFHLLVATQLAAQCTDERVNKVTPALFERFPDPSAFAGADAAELERLIFSTGFYHNKAKNLISCGKMLCDEFGGEVPDTMEELLRLPGVGRKTANIILGDIFKKGGVVVDTHAGRIARRVGLTKHTDPTKVEMELAKIIPVVNQTRFCHQLVFHGREKCNSRVPKCAHCQIIDYCAFGLSV